MQRPEDRPRGIEAQLAMERRKMEHADALIRRLRQRLQEQEQLIEEMRAALGGGALGQS